jgi:hypothetical protein
MDRFDRYLDANRQPFVSELRALCRIPSGTGSDDALDRGLTDRRATAALYGRYATRA